jgi:hypothetical protein
MGQTSVPETLVLHQKLTPGYNPKTFKQQVTYYQDGQQFLVAKCRYFMIFIMCRDIELQRRCEEQNLLWIDKSSPVSLCQTLICLQNLSKTIQNS